MATIFVREHNAICDRLRDEYPFWTDEEIFQRRAPRQRGADREDPHGRVDARGDQPSDHEDRPPRELVGPRRRAAAQGRLYDDEVVSGIPGSETNHYGVPYSLTEEFVAVYRMHPLIPDDYSFRAAADDSAIREATFREIAGPYATGVMEEIPISDLSTRSGRSIPGS